jgi:tight adherence protein B
MKQEDGRQKRLHRLEGQFLTGMQAVSNALAAGYSVEYAFVAAEGEVKKTGELELIAEEFSWIVRQLSFHQPLESLLEDLAFRSGLEDIGNFAELFAVAKKSGGDLIAIIRNTISSISQKEETRGEIRVCISSKKLEQKIMSLVPLLILAYVRLASPGFLDVMYHNVAGIAIMSGCLAVYAFAWFLGKRIAEIEV